MAARVVRELIDPRSIVIVGGSNNVHKPGGKLIRNIKEGTFQGELYVVNPKEEEVQGYRSYSSVEDIPDTEMAILAIPARLCPDAVRTLAGKKKTRAFIIVSAGFSEESEEGKKLEQEIAGIIDGVHGSLIGPNCIGVMTPFYQGVFTLPIPKLSEQGCDFISGSGATAVFIMESGIPKGLTFASVFSVGNSALIGVEDMLEYFDESYVPESSSPCKILYIESIKKPQKLLKHASSLIQKGCRIAAIKAGSSEAGSRAASSHTGALASPDEAVDALFRKAGIVRCFGREELSTVAGIFTHRELSGKNVAIITHAGGPAVMLTDVLSRGGFTIPPIHGPDADELLQVLFPGSSVANPIDILATGTADQVGICIDFCEKRFANIDVIMIIFGSSGLTEVFDVYDVIHDKMRACRKPIFAVMPSISTAGKEVQSFREKGHIVFYDEVLLGEALVKIRKTPEPVIIQDKKRLIPAAKVSAIIPGSSSGYLDDQKVYDLLNLVEIPSLRPLIINNRSILERNLGEMAWPVVMKVIGPIHKSDVGGVILNITSEKELINAFERIAKIDGFKAAMVQPMLEGTELFLGANYEENFGHMIYCGLGGIFVETIRDVASGLVPLNLDEAHSMIRSLRSYKILEGTRGREGVNIDLFADIIFRLSNLLESAPMIREMDLNPMIGNKNKIIAVDARVRI